MEIAAENLRQLAKATQGVGQADVLLHRLSDATNGVKKQFGEKNSKEIANEIMALAAHYGVVVGEKDFGKICDSIQAVVTSRLQALGADQKKWIALKAIADQDL